MLSMPSSVLREYFILSGDSCSSNIFQMAESSATYGMQKNRLISHKNSHINMVPRERRQ